MTIFPKFLACLSIGALMVSTGVAAAQPPIKLGVSSPKAKGVDGLLQDSGWNLTFRLRSELAPSYIEVREAGEGGSNYDLLVLEDPDDCLDLSHANMVGGALEAGCPGGPDETFVTFHVDPVASRRLADSACNAPFLDDLKDTPVADFVSQGGAVPFTEASKSYYFSQFLGNRFQQAGPLTEFSTIVNDCYGYGADEDLPSLVLMADAGGAKMFDTDLTFDTTRIRNMAGLLSSVGYELLNRKDEIAIVGNLFVTDGMLEPLIFVDVGVNELGFGPYTDPQFAFRIESGAVQTVQLTGVFSNAEYIAAIQEEVAAPTRVKLRAVVVQGTAPNFIDDLDNNGKFTKHDLELGGYTLLSNQTITTLNMISREVLRVEEDNYECPNNFLYTDLDADGQARGCQDGDGTSRSAIRVPR